MHGTGRLPLVTCRTLPTADKNAMSNDMDWSSQQWRDHWLKPREQYKNKNKLLISDLVDLQCVPPQQLPITVQMTVVLVTCNIVTSISNSNCCWKLNLIWFTVQGRLQPWAWLKPVKIRIRYHVPNPVVETTDCTSQDYQRFLCTTAESVIAVQFHVNSTFTSRFTSAGAKVCHYTA